VEDGIRNLFPMLQDIDIVEAKNTVTACRETHGSASSWRAWSGSL